MGDDVRIPTNLRTLRILEVLGNSDNPMSPTEINLQLGLPKQTIHRLCSTLVAEGYLSREKTGKRLRPSRRLKNLASGILYNSRDQAVLRQVLLEVAEQVRETVNLVVPEEDGMLYLERVETDWPFRIQLPVGSHVPFHCTASGKTFIASMLPAKRRRFVEGLYLNRLTLNTFVDPEEFLKELQLVSKRGYAVDDEEFHDGMVALAVPIRDAKSRYCGALAFHGPTQRLTIEKALGFKEVLLGGAKKLENAFFA